MARVPLYLTHAYPNCHHHTSCCNASASSQYPSVSIFDQSSITSTFFYVRVPIQQLPSQYAPSYLAPNSSNLVVHVNPNPFRELATIPEMPSSPPRLRRQLRNQNEVESKNRKMMLNHKLFDFEF
uniref:Uncharacterized protein n=1 Tax=Panagrolaimus superbus TaxID=310955 RepID=A0A914Y6B7_9BILA